MSSISVAGDTSGSVTIAAPAVAGSGTLTLPVATDTLVGKATTDTLTNKSIAATQLTGTIAAAALPAGSVLQVVQGTYAVETVVASTTYTDTGLSATITPKFATSKVLVIISQVAATYIATNTNNYAKVQILRGASVLISYPTAVGGASGTNGSGYQQVLSSTSLSYLDSPATTSATTYKTQGAATNIVSSGAVSFQTNSSASTITLMEIVV